MNCKRLRLSLKGQKGLANVHDRSSTVTSPIKSAEISINELCDTDDLKEDDFHSCTTSLANQENIDLTQVSNSLLRHNLCATGPRPSETLPRCNRESENAFSISTIDNLGNTCYVNSVIYVLRYVKEFRKQLHDMAYRHQELISAGAICDQQTDAQHAVILQLHEVLRSMRQRELHSLGPLTSHFEDGRLKPTPTQPLKPVKFMESLRRANSIYDGCYQHDAHELLGFILNWSEKTVQCFEQWSMQHSNRRKSKRINKSQQPKFNSNHLSCPSKTLFEGINIVKTTCLECETVSKMEDKFREIAVPFFMTSKFETENIKNVFRMQSTMCGEDKVWCSICHHYNEALHCSHIIKLPPVLVLQLKHVVAYSDILKNARKIQVKSSTIPKVIPCLLDSCIKCTSDDHHFHIGAVICHIGSTLDSGHYTVYLHKNMASSDLNSMAPELPNLPQDRHQREGRPYNTRRNSSSSSSVMESNDSHNLPSCNDNCCEPLPYPMDSQWLHFNDEKVEMADDLPEFNAEHASETPYLLFYYKR